jgi:hypothetical protein
MACVPCSPQPVEKDKDPSHGPKVNLCLLEAKYIKTPALVALVENSGVFHLLICAIKQKRERPVPDGLAAWRFDL